MIGQITYTAVLVILLVLVIKKPHVAVVGILCMFGVDQIGQIYIPYLQENSIVTNLYVVSLVLFVALPLAYKSSSFDIRFRAQHCKVRLLSVALFLFALLSLTWSPGEPWDNWQSSWPYLLVSVLAAPLLIGRIDDLPEMQSIFVWLGGSLVLFLASVPEWGVRSLIISSTTEEMGAPLALAQLAGYLLITAVVQTKTSYTSLAWVALVVIGALVVAIKSGSRGQLIFSIFSILLVLPLVWEKLTLRHILQLIATGALIIGLSYYIFVKTGVYSGRWQPAELVGDLSERFQMAKLLLTEWFESPLAIFFGLGNSASFSSDLLGIYPHIVPLEVLGEEGIVGFVLFVSIIVLSVGQANRFNKLSGLSTAQRRTFAANFGCFIFTLLLSMKQGSLITSPALFLFAVISEKYLYLVRYQSEPQAEKAQERIDRIAPRASPYPLSSSKPN